MSELWNGTGDVLGLSLLAARWLQQLQTLKLQSEEECQVAAGSTLFFPAHLFPSEHESFPERPLCKDFSLYLIGQRWVRLRVELTRQRSMTYYQRPRQNYNSATDKKEANGFGVIKENYLSH